MSRTRWTEGYRRPRRRERDGTCCVAYSLNELTTAGLVRPRRAARFRAETGLVEFAWEVTWATQSGTSPGEALAAAQGCVILIHGWDGSHAIWEQIPAQICQGNPRLLVLAPDVNGFGRSPFAEALPPLTACDPSAAMKAVEAWVNLLGLRSSPRARTRYRVFTFVGHSMGGAGTFYLDEAAWRPHEAARLAVAPALLLDDALRKEFYKALGLGIWAGSATRTLDWLKDLLAPPLIDALIGDASETVKKEHLRVFKDTPKGVLAQTFYAMGAPPRSVQPRRWRHFRVLLGHRDRLVGLAPMLLLLEKLGFTSDDVRVMLGDHYFFSVGQKSRRLHAPNRDLLVQQVLDLDQECRHEQRRTAR
jgi:pimeloyl-ACP methyl ester carboxylesterase